MSPNARPQPVVSPFAAASVGQVMSRDVLSCPPDASLASVAVLMSEHRVHAVVVFGRPGSDTGDEVWGVLSSLDLVAAAQVDADGQDAGSVAASPVVTVDPSSGLERAAQLMAEYRTGHLVVVDPDTGQPVGIVSDLDLARVLAGAAGR